MRATMRNHRSRKLLVGVALALAAAACGMEDSDARDDALASDIGLTTSTSTAPIASIVVPILLVPSDQYVDQTQLLQLYQALDNVRLWYQREVPRVDIRFAPLKILDGRQTAAHYREHVWRDIPEEIRGAFGWSPWDSGRENHIALVIGRGLLGWAGGAGSTDGQGLAVVGLEALADQAACQPEWWCNQQLWHGAAIQTLGYALAVPNDTDPDSIMNWHGDYKHKHFIPSAQEIVRRSHAAIPKGPYPLAVWSFDECVEGTIEDESGAGYGLVITDQVRCTPGLIENAGTFDGSLGIGETTRPGPSVSNRFTVTAWVKPDRITGVQSIVNQWYVMDAWSLIIDEGEFVLSVAYPEPGGWGRVVRVRAPGARVGQWSHVGAVYTGRELRLYVDGRLGGVTPTRGAIQASDRPIALGNHPTWNAFAGQIDQVRLYRAALDHDEIFSY